MKKIMFIASIVLGMVLTTSCSSMMYAQDYGYGYGYGYGGYGTVQQMPSQSGLFVASKNLNPTGTYVVGQ